jgi:hypothetical protein
MEISQFTTLYLGWEKTCSVFFHSGWGGGYRRWDPFLAEGGA